MLDESKKIFFTEKEWATLQTIENIGFKPISPTLSTEMLNLYMENYSCEKIAKVNKGFSETDVLYCRYKYGWDESRNQYAKQLQDMAVQKILKFKLEAIEFLTNMLSSLHKEEREKMLIYLQTGKEEDKPKVWATNISSYKAIIETIQKLTGESSVQKHEVKAEHKISTSPELRDAITKEIQSSLLKQLVLGKDKK